MCNGSIKVGNVDSAYELKKKADLAYVHGLGERHILLSCADRDALETETRENAPSLKKDE